MLTGLIIEVPEIEDVVRAHRSRLDPQAALGVPAHVTVLYPFAPAEMINDGLLARVREVVGGTARFEFALARTAWFGTDVLWLAPEPAAPFRELTSRISQAFPQWPPYNGVFDDPVPHLTVADQAPVSDMRGADLAVRAALPVSAVARAVTLMIEQPSGEWITAARFPLAAPA